MSYKPLSWSGIGLRFLFALILVLATYNPEEYSYFHWGIQNISENSALKVFVGIVLLIGWVIYIRATLRSLGPIGLILALGFFGTLIWLLIDYNIVSTDSAKVITYLVLIIASAILTTGMSWTHIRRRMSGQLDVDDVDED
jgi:drug/metabolite transporter (DMT)-like permease